MNDDKKLKDFINKTIDNELNNIGFSFESQEKIYREVLKQTPIKESIIKRFLNYEIVIPIKPAIAIAVALFIGLGSTSYAMFKVDERDILASKIEIVKLK